MSYNLRYITSILFVLLITFSWNVSFSQENQLTGKVTDSKTGEILPGAHIFVNKTTIGTASDTNGNYKLIGIPGGVQTIIISFIGFKDYIVDVDFSQQKRQRLEVKLEPKAFSFNEVQVVSSNKEWKKNLERFKKHFFGFTINAGSTEIANPEVLSFENSGSELTATAEAPLTIVNKALGYEITYHLTKSISTDHYFDSRFFMKFEEVIPESKEVLKNWHLEREKAYKGSFIHFLNSLKNGSYLEEGFKVFASKKNNLNNFSDRPDSEKLFLDEFVQLPIDNKWVRLSVPEPDRFDFIEVAYLKEEIDYQLIKRMGLRGSPSQRSWIEISNDIAIINIQNGAYSDHFSFALHGYWGWTNRIPELLPENYKPQNELDTE